MVLVGGREEIHRENRLTIILPKSVRRWAASVMMARLWARYPPGDQHKHEGQRLPAPLRRAAKAASALPMTSPIMKTRQTAEAMNSFFLATSLSAVCSPAAALAPWQWAPTARFSSMAPDMSPFLKGRSGNELRRREGQNRRQGAERFVSAPSVHTVMKFKRVTDARGLLEAVTHQPDGAIGGTDPGPGPCFCCFGSVWGF